MVRIHARKISGDDDVLLDIMFIVGDMLELSLSSPSSLLSSPVPAALVLPAIMDVTTAGRSQLRTCGSNSIALTVGGRRGIRRRGRAIVIIVVVVIVGVLSHCKGDKEGEDNLGEMHFRRSVRVGAVKMISVLSKESLDTKRTRKNELL